MKIEKDIENARNEFLKINKILKKESVKQNISTDSVYYSHWLYSALHIAVSIPNLQTLAQLSKHFLIPANILHQYLEKLETMQLIQQTGHEKWIWKSGDLHLPNESPLVTMHQSSWRSKAVENSAYKFSDSLHYTVVQSISKDDFERLRLIVLEWIGLFQKISGPSKSEELVNLNIDFYQVVKGI